MTRQGAAYLFTRVSVDANAGTVTWIDPPKYHPNLKGMPSGSMQPNHAGKLYCVIRINRRGYKRSHLVFLAHHGRWPTPCVDHIDGDSTNDRIDNLREATVTQNAWNHKGRRKTTQLPMGVKQVGSRFQARIACNKRVFHLGTFNTVSEARSVYQSKREELYGDFAGT